MAYKEIIKIGNPSLRMESEAIEEHLIPTQEVQEIIAQLFDHMAHYGGVGLAAPQIGIKKRIFVYGFDHNPRYPHEGPVPLTAVINPVISNKSKEMLDGYEGCLSVRGLRGVVPRHKSLTVEGFNAQGSFFTKKVSGFEARIIQHEYDHLDGLTFVDKIKDFQTFGFTDELKAHGMID